MSVPRGSETAACDAAELADWLNPTAVALRTARLEDAALVVRRLAHDFGNVLTGILGFSEISLGLLSHASPIHQYTLEVLRCAQQGAGLTQRLRWFSGRETAKSESSSLAEVIGSEQSRLRSVCSSAVQLRFSIAPPLPRVAICAEPLKQVLQQLLDNAWEALEAGGNITLSARPIHLTDAECRRLLGAPKPGPNVEVTLCDDGCGLSAEARQRLFLEPFYCDKPRHGGLGLATVYGILRNYRGGFRLDNASGGGTIVRLVLPIAEPSRSRASSTAAARNQGERILVVDDDPGVLNVVSATLERAGYRVQSAAGGMEALERYATTVPRGFELVLCDVVMPQLSGVDLARCLLEQDANANVLFMSGLVSAEFAQSEPFRGRFGVLAKPFRADGLLRAVRTALDRHPLLAETASGPET
jgi:CheY-like chemotaxis protein